MKGPSLAVLLILVPGASVARATTAGETAEAREQAWLCERLDEEPGIAACRAALAAGIGLERRTAVRQILANHLVDLERWTELGEHYREDVRLDPEDAEAWFRLGSTLLFALNERAEALAALDEAARLDPGSGGAGAFWPSHCTCWVDSKKRRMRSTRPSGSTRPCSRGVPRRRPCGRHPAAGSPGREGANRRDASSHAQSRSSSA